MNEDQSCPDDTMPPYVIEGARSGRARCKSCRRVINKGSLRIGVLVHGAYGPGHMWHHLTCLARRQPDRVEEAYELEAWNEAKEPPAKVPTLKSLLKAGQKSASKKEQQRVPYAEVAPTGRSKCKFSGEPIEKGAFRVVLSRQVEFGEQVRQTPVKVLPAFVVEELNRPDSGVEFEGFAQALRENSSGLTPQQIDAVLEEIGQL